MLSHCRMLYYSDSACILSEAGVCVALDKQVLAPLRRKILQLLHQ